MARKIIGLLAIFITFYLAAHFWIRSRRTITNDVAKITRLVDCHPNEVREVKIVPANGAQVVGFVRTDQATPGMPEVTALARSSWSFQAPMAGEADSVLLKRIASTICELYDPILLRESNLAEAPKPDPKSAKLEFQLLHNGKTENYSIVFGDTDSNRKVLVRLAGPRARATARVADQLLDLVSLPKETYLNLRVMRLEADNVTRATVKFNGVERFSLSRVGPAWRVSASGKDLGPASEEASKFVNRLATLRAVSIAKAEFSAQECQKEKAGVIVDFEGVGGRNETLRIDYGQAGDGTACTSSRSAKFRVHRALAQYLDVPVNKLRSTAQ